MGGEGGSITCFILMMIKWKHKFAATTALQFIANNNDDVVNRRHYIFVVTSVISLLLIIIP